MIENIKDKLKEAFNEHFGPYAADEVSEEYAEAIVKWIGVHNLAIVSLDRVKEEK